MDFVSLDEVFKNLGIERRKSEMLEKMTKDEILNMTPEQAEKICEEVGTGWRLSTESEQLEFLNSCEVEEDGTIRLKFDM